MSRTSSFALVALTIFAQLAFVRNAVITFTGNITRDFTTDYFSLPDRKELSPDCGFDVLDVVFSYDHVSDTGYFGERLLCVCVSIFSTISMSWLHLVAAAGVAALASAALAGVSSVRCIWRPFLPTLPLATGVRSVCIFGDVDCDGNPSVYSGTDGTVADIPWVGTLTDPFGTQFYGACVCPSGG